MSFWSLKFQVARPIAIILVIFTVLFCFLVLPIGVSELFYPDVPPEYFTQNTVVCILIIAIGLVLILGSIAAVRGSLLTPRKS
jgi:hypothetical protein